ncbi:hypothetical protein HOLleu_43507 [Holothuria leucospilota]|uniref:Uncharacterized protein n=1 Tax=Holothuria leucospilota TaxID=206669 RepID=A0A9Q0YGW2_HOLLE|nr:hypothetical protein HOLleu_43507 [Holothuria leucospilota]
MWMHYGAKVNNLIFGGGQRSFGGTGGQKLKTLLTQYRQMHYNEKVNPIICGGGQRSSEVTGGQTLKTLLIRYLQVGSLDRFHTQYVDALW